MKGFSIFAVLVALLAVCIWQHGKISALNLELSLLKARLTVKSQPPQSALRKIICPVCKGEKVIIYGSNPLNRKTQNCPVCIAQGFRMLTVLRGYHVCPDCNGMGKVHYPSQPNQPVAAENCIRCAATGLLADIK